MYKIGDIVSILPAKGPRLDVIIIDIEPIRRGRFRGRNKYSLAPLTKPAKEDAYGFKVTGANLFGKPSREYTAAEISAATGKYEDNRDNAQEHKRERRNARRNKLDTLAIEPGDEVLVRYKGSSPLWETVVKVNQASGNVAIQRGYSSKPRWINIMAIISSRKPQAKLPFKLTDAHLEALAEKGWIQVSFGSEFIERSYVVAFETYKAQTMGETYDAPNRVVYQDADLKVFWRNTGSFD